MAESLSLVGLALILGFLVVPRWIEMGSWKIATEVNSMVSFFTASVAVSHSRWLKDEMPMEVLFGLDSLGNEQHLKMNAAGWPVGLVKKMVPQTQPSLGGSCKNMWNIFVEKRLFDQSLIDTSIEERIGTITKDCRYFIANEFLIDYKTNNGSVVLSKVG